MGGGWIEPDFVRHAGRVVEHHAREGPVVIVAGALPVAGRVVAKRAEREEKPLVVGPPVTADAPVPGGGDHVGRRTLHKRDEVGTRHAFQSVRLAEVPDANLAHARQYVKPHEDVSQANISAREFDFAHPACRIAKAALRPQAHAAKPNPFCRSPIVAWLSADWAAIVASASIRPRSSNVGCRWTCSSAE